MLMEALEILVFALLGIPVFVFGLYGIIALYYGKIKRNRFHYGGEGSINAKFEPSVSVVVPTHNEELIVSKKLENLVASDYPKDKLEIVFVDDSSDSTPERIGEFSKKFANVRLIRFSERMGYSPSMIAGCQAAKGEIVILNDAGSFIDAQAIRNLVSHFQDPSVGLVTGKAVIMNLDETAGKSESLYERILSFLRTAETRMDSTFYIKGEATAVRKDLIKDLDMCSETFDTTAGLFVRQKGYKAIYDSNVKFYEYAPATHSGRIKQKTIRATNLIRALLRFRHMIFKHEYGKYGSIVLPMNFGMLIVAPLSIFAALVFLVPLTFLNLGLSTILWTVVGLAVLFCIVFFRNLLLTFIELEYSLLKALFQVVFTKKGFDKIEKVPSTRRP